LYDAALQIEPGSRAAKRALAFYSIQIGKPESAIQIYQQLADGSTDGAERIVFADVLRLAGKRDQSIEVLQGIAGKDPSNVIVRRRLGNIYLESREYSKAMQLANEIIQKNSNDSEAHLIRGRVLLAEGNIFQATEELRNLAKSKPGFLAGKLYLGIA